MQLSEGWKNAIAQLKQWVSPCCPFSPLFPSQGCQSYRKCWTQQPRRTGRWQLSTSWRQQKRATACCSRSWRRRRKGWWWWTVNLSGWTSSSARFCWCGSSGRGLTHRMGKVVSPGVVLLLILVWFMYRCSFHWMWCVCIAAGSWACKSFSIVLLWKL